MKPEYRTIEQLLGLIDEPNRSACLRLYSDNVKLLQTVQGSTNNHQAWSGGYHDHVQEIMNIAVGVYEMISPRRPLLFTLSDLLSRQDDPVFSELGDAEGLMIFLSFHAGAMMQLTIVSEHVLPRLLHVVQKHDKEQVRERE